jgi:hypothetical protein
MGCPSNPSTCGGELGVLGFVGRSVCLLVAGFLAVFWLTVIVIICYLLASNKGS